MPHACARWKVQPSSIAASSAKRRRAAPWISSTHSPSGWSYQKPAGLLWPVDPVSRAEARVRACLNPDRAEKFSPEELIHLAQLARRVGDHSIMTYLAQRLGYTLTPIEPRDQLAELQHEYIEAARTIQRIAERIERAQVRAVG